MKFSMRNVVMLLVICTMLTSGCAKKANTISPTFASASEFVDTDCVVLKDNLKQSKVELADTEEVQNTRAIADTVLMAVGLVVFWPALIPIMFTGDDKEKIGNLKGKVRAMSDEYLRRCNK